MQNTKTRAPWFWVLLVMVLAGVGWAVSACALAYFGESGASLPSAPTLTPLVILTTPPAHPATPTLTNPPADRPATATPPPTQTASPTRLPSPTRTPLPPTPTPLPYQMQLGSPKYAAAFSHANLGCKWLGIAGQALDAKGGGVKDLAVLVTGTINDQRIERAVLTGSQEAYGPGGYEVLLAEALPAPGTTFEVQLFDVQSNPLSSPQVVKVPTTCEQNLVVINFLAGGPTNELFAPLIMD